MASAVLLYYYYSTIAIINSYDAISSVKIDRPQPPAEGLPTDRYTFVAYTIVVFFFSFRFAHAR